MSSKIAKVAIILGFYNGNKFLIEQLKSIISQTQKNLKIFIFNDKSTQKILNLEKAYLQNSDRKISVVNRKENQGFAKNFLLGLEDVGANFDYYAFSDQDDIWENNKVEDALKEISKFDYSKPVLYCSRTTYISNDSSKEIGSSKNFKKVAIFKNALIQNIAGGNTIVMNKEARNLVVKSLKCSEYVSHDWWCYQIISAAGGEIIFSSKKSLKYRQHDKNLIGGNNSFKEKLIRFRKFFSGSFKIWVDINIENLKSNKKFITESNLIVLKTFIKARESKNIFKKLTLYLKSGVYRQTFSENIIFLIGLLFNKI
tara:strand:- start:1630 stop:2568 length:939 start_codon:yes stop_codon:yes gene_type:complete